MKKSFPNHLTNTRKALKWYNSTLQTSLRLEAFNKAMDDISIQHWLQLEKTALDRVRLAFWEDTKEINNKDNCMMMDIATLEKWCKKAEQEM